MNHRVLSLLLCAALLCGALAGCGGSPFQTTEAQPETTLPQSTATQATTQAPTQTPTQPSAEPDGEPVLAWSQAFPGRSLAEDGELDESGVAFLRVEENGTELVLLAPKQELAQSQDGPLPWTDFFTKDLAPALREELLPALHYALINGFCAVCLPSTRLTQADVEGAAEALCQTYRLQSDAFRVCCLRETALPDGKTLRFLQLELDETENGAWVRRAAQGLDSAQWLVRGIPKDLSEVQILSWLYRWLTVNVSCSDEADGSTGLDQLYNAMCEIYCGPAGFGEALYVLCNLAGLDCVPIEGELVENGRSQRQVWDAVRIDGTYYQFDAAWDAGLRAADYSCCGLSELSMRENRERRLSAYSEAHCPPCERNLLEPPLTMPEDQNAAAYAIFWYYRLRNARDADPLLLFSYFGWDEARVGAEEPRNGLVRTKLDINKLIQGLMVVMTKDQALRFNFEYITTESEEDDYLSYRLPPEDAEQTRLTGLEDNGDGSWTASVVRFLSDGTFVLATETVTMEKINGLWYVSFVK